MSLTLRAAAIEDSFTAFKIFEAALDDLGRRAGVQVNATAGDPAAWERRRPLFEHLARTAEHFWLAEKDGKPVGYARSILRDGVRELTELFVLPGEQSAGVGRKLLAGAFPADGAKHRVIIATGDVRAMARYLKAGVYPRFPVADFYRKPEPAPARSDLRAEVFLPSPDAFNTLRELDVELLGHRRDVDHAFLLESRQGFFYYRGDQPVGYGYVGERSGPFAVLSGGDFPGVLAHAEAQARALGLEDVHFQTPLSNSAAVDYLLLRGYRMDPYLTYFLSEAPFGKFENYLLTDPPFFF